VFEADHLPANLVRVAAILGICEEPGDGRDPNGLEELRVFRVQLLEQRDLLFRSEVGERLRARAPPGGPCGEIGQPALEERPLVRRERAETTIDEVHDAGFPRAGHVVGGNDERAHGVQIAGLSRGQRRRRGAGRTPSRRAAPGAGNPGGGEAGGHRAHEMAAGEGTIRHGESAGESVLRVCSRQPIVQTDVVSYAPGDAELRAFTTSYQNSAASWNSGTPTRSSRPCQRISSIGAKMPPTP